MSKHARRRTNSVTGRHHSATTLGLESLEQRQMMAGHTCPGGGYLEVNRLDDVIDTNPNSTSLREAVIQANACPGKNVIILPAGHYSLSLRGADDKGGDLDITDDLELRGPSERTANGLPTAGISAGGIDRVFDIAASAKVTVMDVILSAGDAGTLGSGGIIHNRGDLTVLGSRLTMGRAYQGGAIFNGGRLTMQESVVEASTASDGGLIKNGDYLNLGAFIKIVDSQLNQGFARERGGGISNYGSQVVLEGSMIGEKPGKGMSQATAGNVSAEIGGGIYNSNGTVTATETTFMSNSAGWAGGAVANYDGSFTLDKSTMEKNSAVLRGGGIDTGGSNSITIINSSNLRENTAAFGGGIANSGKITARNSTLEDNKATHGGGIFNAHFGKVTLNASTLNRNNAFYGGGLFNEGLGTFTLNVATLKGNSAAYGGAFFNAGNITATDATFAENKATGWAGGGDIFNGQDGQVTLVRPTFLDGQPDLAGAAINIVWNDPNEWWWGLPVFGW